MLDTILGEVKPNIARYADMISKTIDADVIIIDTNYELIAGTFRYFGLHSEISMDSMIAEVISAKKPVVIRDKADSKSCVNCTEFKECKIVGFVGVPILLDNIVIGAIALILPRHRTTSLFANIDETVEFLNNMSLLLSDKVNKVRENNSLNKELTSRYNLMDMLDDGIVYTDYFGNISYCNIAFQKMFNITDSNKNINDIVQNSVIENSIRNKVEIKNQQMIADNFKYSFYGRVYSKMYKFSDTDKGFLFCFSKLANNSCYKLTDMSYLPDFDNVCKKLDIDINVLSQNIKNSNILIKGKDIIFNLQVAYQISKKCYNIYDYIRVDCGIMCGERIENLLFSNSIGVTHIQDTVVILADYDTVPQYIKNRLAGILESGQLDKKNIHFIFISKNFNENVNGLNTNGNVIVSPEVTDNQEILETIVINLLDFYKIKNDKVTLNITDVAVKNICSSMRGKTLGEIEQGIDRIVSETTENFLNDNMQTFVERPQQARTVEDFERQKLEELVAKGINKTKIAKELGISRATLYRKLELYKLN